MTDEFKCQHCPLFGHWHTGRYTFLYECNYETIYRYVSVHDLHLRKQMHIEPLRKCNVALTTKELKKTCPRKGDKI